MTDRARVSDERAAWSDLEAPPNRAICLERQSYLPFTQLSDDAYEICCFILLLREFPGERIYYYGKTGDKGRDIVRIRPDGTVEFIQCKRYSDNVGVGEVRKEMAKLCVNVFEKQLPEIPDHITFYVVPDLSSPAQDLLRSQDAWRAVAPAALEEHLGEKPSADLLAFAMTWWPSFDRVTAPALSVRVEGQPSLLDRFFAVKKVIEGSAADLQGIQEQLRTLNAGLATVVPSLESQAPDAGAGTPPTRAQELVAGRREKVWEERARRSLDAQGQQLWEEIRAQIRELNTIQALDRGKVLRAWLLGEGAHASPAMRGRVCILLADLAVIESSIASHHEHIDVTDARAWQTRAAEELGDSPTPEDASRLLYLDARLVWLEGRPDEALTALDATDDANCLSLKLSILITEGRDAEAAAATRVLALDDRWCDRMVLAYAKSGLAGDAAPVYAWAQARPEPAVYDRCLIAWAQGTLQRLFKGRDLRSLFFEALPPDDHQTLRELLASLEPLFAATISRGQPTPGVETEALELAFVICRLLRERERYQQYGALLSKAAPVSLDYAGAVCRGEFDGAPDLSGRIRADYPRSFAAGHLAAVLDAFAGKPFSEVAKMAESLTSLAKTRDQREEVAELLFETALGEEGTTALDQARTFCGQLLGEEHRLIRLAQCETLRRAGKTQDAEALLAACRDESDMVWLQIAAMHEWRKGDTRAALGHFLGAARLFGRPDLCWRAFSLAHQLNDTEAMRELMQILSRLTPDDPKVHRNLAAMAFRAGRFREVAASLQRVDVLAPGVAETGLFLGQALALAGRGDNAVQVLDRTCTTHPEMLAAHHLRAMILDSLGKPVLAFEGLHAARERFWGDISFVQMYHGLAYKANREEDAHLAFLRLQELQAGDPNGPLRGGTLDDLREMVRQDREHHDQLNRQILEGRMPWPVAGRVLRREAYIDWAIRTQEALVPDAPVARAEYAVYATNGLTVRADGDTRSLEPITASPANLAVIADLSALLTLHRLGLLEPALAYFGRVVLPAGYAARFLEETRSLQPHQASQVEARRAILAAIDQGRLRAAPSAAPGSPAMPLLEEHHVEDERVEFHLIDAVTWLQRTGRLSDDEVGRVRPFCHRSPVAPGDSAFHTAAASGMRIGVATLSTLHGVGLLDRFLASIKLNLDQDEVEELRRDLLGFERRAELNGWTRELRDLLTADARVETAEPALPAGIDDETESDRELDPALGALLLAEQRKLPLLADDRWLQATVLNSRHGQRGTAFGTDCLLAQLASDSRISEHEWVAAWLQLARWRYRFLVPPPDVLVALAARHPNFPPGEELRDVCRYVHDCCLDPGLLCGMEPVQPPVSVGWRYFQSVVQAIGHFLMQVWHDPRFDRTALVALTRWAANEFVPPPPRKLPHAGSVIASESVPRIVLVSALVDAPLYGNMQRSNEALVAIADAFGLTPDEYDDTVAILLESERDLPVTADSQTVGRALRLTAHAALQHRHELGIRAASILANLGLLDPLEDSTGEDDAAALGDPAHPRRAALVDGPWVFTRGAREGEPNVARYVPDLLYHPKQSIRRAAVAHFTGRGLVEPAWLTPGTRQHFSSIAADIAGEDAGRARAAARAANVALSRDFLLSIARFRQSRSSHMPDENAEALRGLLEPRTGTLGSVPTAWYSPPGDEWADFCATAVREPTIGAALDRYYERYGHLPLGAAFAIEAIVRKWVETRGEDGVWDAVQIWARDDSRPLKRYHACRICLSIPSLVPDEARARMWTAVTEVLGGFEQAPANPTLCGQTWLLLHSLAKHYLQLLEVESHEEDATSLAALAWWAAERVTHVLAATALTEFGSDRSVEVIRGIVVRGLAPLARRSAMGCALGRPRRSPSAFAHGTLHLNSLWRPSLLEAGPGAGLRVPYDHVESVCALLTLALATGFPTRLDRVPSSGIAVETGLATLAARWSTALPAGEPEEVESVDQQAEAPAGQSEVSEHLRNICEWDEDARLLPLLRVRNAVGLGGTDALELRWILDDRQWWDTVFDRLTRDQLDALIASLLDLMRSGNEEWQLSIPHLFRIQALRDQIGSDKQSAAAGAVVQAAIISGQRGALASLVRDATAPDLLSHLTDWKQRLAGILPVVPPSVQAMCRTVLAVLPPDGGA